MANKFGNVRVADYDSRMELEYQREVLFPLYKAKEIKSFKHHVVYRLDVKGPDGTTRHVCDYEADYVVTRKDGVEEVHEVKGFCTKEYRIKKKLFHAVFPDVPFHEIQKDQLRKGLKPAKFKRNHKKVIQLIEGYEDMNADDKKKIERALKRRFGRR